jgi:hypothetical protein
MIVLAGLSILGIVKIVTDKYRRDKGYYDEEELGGTESASPTTALGSEDMIEEPELSEAEKETGKDDTTLIGMDPTDETVLPSADIVASEAPSISGSAYGSRSGSRSGSAYGSDASDVPDEKQNQKVSDEKEKPEAPPPPPPPPPAAPAPVPVAAAAAVGAGTVTPARGRGGRGGRGASRPSRPPTAPRPSRPPSGPRGPPRAPSDIMDGDLSSVDDGIIDVVEDDALARMEAGMDMNGGTPRAYEDGAEAERGERIRDFVDRFMFK